MTKLSPYAKLKAENARLKREVHILAMKPDTYEADVIRAREILKAGVENAVWFGDVANKMDADWKDATRYKKP